MMMWAAPDAPHLVDLARRHAVYRIVPSCQVVASASCACERFAAWCSIVVWYCSGMSARLVGHDSVACPRVLQGPRYV
jgi:hypothetical protein